MKKEKKLVTSERTVFTVGYLRQVSWHALKEAKEVEQEQISIKDVQRYFDDTKEMVEFLHVASGLDFNPLHVPETAGWSISPVNEENKSN